MGKISVKEAMEVAGKVLKKNAPTLMMWFGVGLMAGGAIDMVPTTVKAIRKVDEENQKLEEKGDRPLSRMEVVGKCWLMYTPAVLIELIGAAFVVRANSMQLMRIAAVGAVAKANEDKLNDYKEAAKKKLGLAEAKKLDSEAAKQHIARMDGQFPTPPQGGASVMRCMDGTTGQLFWASKQQIEHAVNEINYSISRGDEVRLQEFLDLLGQKQDTEAGRVLGWGHDINGQAHHLLEIDYSFIEDEMGNPVLYLQYDVDNISPF